MRIFTARGAFPAILALAVATAFATPASAGMSKEELAKVAQNPVANLISVPFQNSTNFHVGPYNRTQDILNVFCLERREL